MTRDANGPGQTARRKSLPKWRAQPVIGTCQHTAEADTGCDQVINLSERYLRLRPCRSMFGRNYPCLPLNWQPPRSYSMRGITFCKCFGIFGGRTRALFLQAGLRDVVTYPKTLVLRELGVADRIFSFFSTAERLA